MLKVDGQKLDDGRWFIGSVDRNKDPILNLLKRVLPSTGLILEIGSGTGQHVAHFAKALPELSWQPSDPDDELRNSIRLWTKLESLDNVCAPIDLEVCRFPWPVTRADAVLCVNMIHVAPWQPRRHYFRARNACWTVEDSWSCMGPIEGLAAIPPQAMRHSTLSCEPPTPPGVCGISKRSSRSRIRLASNSRRWSRCLPII